MNKFSEICRTPSYLNKFKIVIYAVRDDVANRTQFNKEGSCELGIIYAIKVAQYRFYCILVKDKGYRDIYICKYEKKQTQKNNKVINNTLEAISKLEFKKPFEDE